jgi:hemolysin III
VSLVVGTLLIVGADGASRRAAAAVFASSVAVCFGASALYHRVTLTPDLRRWMRRVDHAGVYLLIAGTYTPVCLLVLSGAWRIVVLAIVYAGAAAAVALKKKVMLAPMRRSQMRPPTRKLDERISVRPPLTKLTEK